LESIVVEKVLRGNSCGRRRQQQEPSVPVTPAVGYRRGGASARALAIKPEKKQVRDVSIQTEIVVVRPAFLPSFVESSTSPRSPTWSELVWTQAAREEALEDFARSGAQDLQDSD